MNSFFLTTALAMVLFTLSVAEVPDNIDSLISRNNRFLETPEAILRARALRQRVVNQGGCNLNACFAIDSSNSVSGLDFLLQKDFVQLVTAIISASETNSAYAAASYGLVVEEISELTSNVPQFLLDVNAANFSPGPFSFISAGLGYCIQQLRPRMEDANKVVLFTDGNANFGGSPARLADRFRRKYHGTVCAVAVGFADTTVLEDIVGGNSALVLPLDGFFELLDILETLVEQVCSLN